MQIPCPHCEKMINPAELLGKTTSEAKKVSSAFNGRKHVGKKSPLGGRRVGREVAMEGLGDPSTWPAHAEAVNAEFRQKPSVAEKPLPAVSVAAGSKDAANQVVGVNKAVPVAIKRTPRNIFADFKAPEPEVPYDTMVREPFAEAP